MIDRRGPSVWLYEAARYVPASVREVTSSGSARPECPVCETPLRFIPRRRS